MSAPQVGARATGPTHSAQTPRPENPGLSARPIPTLLVAASGSPVRMPWQRPTGDIESLLDRLEANGREVVSMQDLLAAIERPTPLDAFGVVLGFIDPGPAFLSRVWPSLEARSISPVLFVHTAGVGQRSNAGPLARFAGRTLSWNELNDLRGRGASVESAGHIGIGAARIPPEVAFSDLVRSCREMENRLGHSPRAVLLGRSRGGADAQDLALRAGFHAAFHADSSPPYRSRWGLGYAMAGRWGGRGRLWGRGRAAATLVDR